MLDENEIRELEKVKDAMVLCHRMLLKRDEMNSCYHMASVCRPSPLTVNVETALETLVRLIRP